MIAQDALWEHYVWIGVGLVTILLAVALVAACVKASEAEGKTRA